LIVPLAAGDDLADRLVALLAELIPLPAEPVEA
jgi:hypothetical protein